MVYRLADDTVSELLRKIQKLAEARLAEVDRIIEHYQDERSEFNLIGFAGIQEFSHRRKFVAPPHLLVPCINPFLASPRSDVIALIVPAPWRPCV